MISIVGMMAAMSSYAQSNILEPEFINSYCILTSDSTYDVLPKESGAIGRHENKVKKWSKIIGKAADLASAAGMIGIGTAGSASGLVAGARTVTTASGVASAAGTVGSLAGYAGLDIIFKGGSSTYQVKDVRNGVRLLIKGENNETDPMNIYRIVRFNASKKERRIQWMEFEPALLGSADTEKAGYLNFEGHKHGEQSYLLTIPASELEEGEYGIFYMSIITAEMIPVGTFSVK